MTGRGGFESFDCAPSHRIEANESAVNLQIDAFSQRLARIEMLIERMEKWLWLMVYGVVGVILAQAFQSLLAATP